MAKKLALDQSGTTVVTVEDSGITLPSFKFVANAGRKALDDIDTDLVLITKLYRMDVPAALHHREPNVADILKRTVNEGFHGKKGTARLLTVPLRNSRGESGRYVLFLGLGQAINYCGQTACTVFRKLFQTAIDLEVESVLVPFVPNPMTKTALTHKATAFKMKSILAEVVAERGHAGKLREIKVFCHPNAVPTIQDGLMIEQGEGCNCHAHPGNAIAKNLPTLRLEG
ncbi:MAG TPA: hypothetical protein V6D22_07790 [Candidatus Obscuribacterales bacterium]